MEPDDNIKGMEFPVMYIGNVNRRVNPYAMQDSELWDEVNWWTERTIGAKKVRPGLTRLFNQVDSNPVKGLFYVKFPGGSKRLVRLSGKSIYAIDPNSASTWGSAKITLTASGQWKRPDYTILAGKIHIVDKVTSNDFHYVEGNASDSYSDTNYVAGTPDVELPYKAATVAQFHRRIYVADPYDGSNEFASMLSWSSIDYLDKGSGATPNPWVTETTLIDVTYSSNREIDEDYNGNIFKLTNINDRLNIYKDEAIYRYNESQVFMLFGMSPIPGSVSTMKETLEDYFLTNEGFFKTDGNTITPLGQGWYDQIRQIFSNGIDLTKVCSGARNFLYFCFVGDVSYDGQTITNACFVYNIYTDELSLWSLGYQITSFGYYVNTSGDNVIVMGDVNGYVYELDYSANDDEGIPIKASFQTKYFYYDDPKNDNQLSSLHGFSIKGSEVEVYVDRDFSKNFQPYLTIDDRVVRSKKDLNEIGRFKSISYRFMWNGKGDRPEVYGFIPKITGLSDLVRTKR